MHNAIVLSSDLILTEHELKCLLFNIVNTYIHHLWNILLTVIMLLLMKEINGPQICKVIYL